ncbi:Putative olfactory receptor 2W6 [Tupaia chinensis]|uniref:Putative olfactory receptor 2W6 n=1 Tax=Tupaia chinensis TaxID=246437 RepID=L8YAS7_TUPCH|nr:Putative olfactory receptor 2W6 [Tupaia chinensis]
MANRSCQGHFILLGFSDRPDLERPLFVFVLISYLAALVGNLLIVLVSRLDSRLHTPMYFFLTNLSLLDLGFTSSAIPQLLVHLRGRARAISWAGCAAQLFLFLALGGAECVLLAAMAYDRFCAVCRPLRYAATVFVLSVAIVLAPLSLILASYVLIARAVLRLGSAGRAKALHTCGAHLAVVALFYGNIVCTYMQPGGAGAQGRFLTLGYSLVTPALNPVIYTLRNKDVKGALRRLVASTRGDQALS